MRRSYPLFVALFLSACGGDSSGSSPGVTIPVVPTLSVTLAPSATDQTVPEADTTTSFTVQATYSGSSADPIYPRLDYDGKLFMLDGELVNSGNSYTVKLKSRADVPAGVHTSAIAFRLCRDSACGTVYPGSAQSFNYNLDVKLGDWVTRQRNAAHDGYVRAAFDASEISKSWEYAPAAAIRFQPVAARTGTIFTVQKNADGTNIVIALDGATGVERWRYSLGNIHSASAPALSGERLSISTMFTSSGSNPTVVLNASSGQFIRNLETAAQWSDFPPPTPFEDSIYIASGYYGNVVYGFDMIAGSKQWESNGSAGHTWDGQAPAIDSRYVYYYSGNLDVFDRASGALVKSITDPFWRWNGYSYGGTPMIGSSNNVIAYSGNGMGTYSISFPLVNYDIEGGVYRWRTASGYTVTPAVAKGVIYAASNEVSELHAIEESTGKVLWAWPLPAGQQFTGNIVATDTLVFVSSTTAIFAIDTQGAHETKWTAPTPGLMAISPDSKLIVTQIPGQSPARVTAYTLKLKTQSPS